MTQEMSLDSDFYRNMAERFPMSSYSCLHGNSQKEPLSSKDFLHTIMDTIIDNVQKEKRIEDTLAAQCGKQWGGIENEEPYRRVTLTILAAYANGYPINEQLMIINKQAIDGITRNSEHIFTITSEMKSAAEPTIKQAEAAHAFNNTVALSIVIAAKQSNGVLPSAHFLWLKKYDRVMWLLLNGYGRYKCFAETLGIISHHHAETIMNRPLAETFMKPAARALMQ